MNKAYNIIRANGSFVTDGIPENWFDENSIPLVDWLPYSFYLNPIEHDWAKRIFISFIQTLNLLMELKDD